MSFHGILGHDAIADRFRRSVAAGRLASTYLFVGQRGIGKRSFAFALARSLLCERNAEAELAACGNCEACVQVAAQGHPDLEYVGLPKGASSLPIELFVGDDDHRMQEGLCHRIGLKPMRGGRKIAIIDDADKFNPASANCLLKTLEEPPPRSVIFLIGTSEHRQLPTIRSRCQTVRFGPLSEGEVATILLDQGLLPEEQATQEQANLLARRSGGSVQQALALADDELWEFRGSLYAEIAQADFDSVSLSKEVASFVDAAGKEAPVRRERLRQICHFVADFYGALMRMLAGAHAEGDDSLMQAAGSASATWSSGLESAADCIERCHGAINAIDRNANLPTLVEAWIDELATTARGESTSIEWP